MRGRVQLMSSVSTVDSDKSQYSFESRSRNNMFNGSTSSDQGINPPSNKKIIIRKNNLTQKKMVIRISFAVVLLVFCFVFFLLEKMRIQETGFVCPVKPNALLQCAVSSFERVYCCLLNLERHYALVKEQIFLY